MENNDRESNSDSHYDLERDDHGIQDCGLHDLSSGGETLEDAVISDMDRPPDGVAGSGDHPILDTTSVRLQEPDYNQMREDRLSRTRTSMKVCMNIIVYNSERIIIKNRVLLVNQSKIWGREAYILFCVIL